MNIPGIAAGTPLQWNHLLRIDRSRIRADGGPGTINYSNTILQPSSTQRHLVIN